MTDSNSPSVQDSAKTAEANSAEEPKLDATTEGIIAMLHSSCGMGPQCGACASYVIQLRRRIRELLAIAREEGIEATVGKSYHELRGSR